MKKLSLLLLLACVLPLAASVNFEVLYWARVEAGGKSGETRLKLLHHGRTSGHGEDFGKDWAGSVRTVALRGGAKLAPGVEGWVQCAASAGQEGKRDWSSSIWTWKGTDAWPTGTLTRIPAGRRAAFGGLPCTLLWSLRKGELLVVKVRVPLTGSDGPVARLFWDGSFMKSMPPQVNIFLVLTAPAGARDGMAAAVPRDVVLQFRIGEVREADVHLFSSIAKLATLEAGR